MAALVGLSIEIVTQAARAREGNKEYNRERSTWRFHRSSAIQKEEHAEHCYYKGPVFIKLVQDMMQKLHYSPPAYRNSTRELTVDLNPSRTRLDASQPRQSIMLNFTNRRDR
jgi:hypothetical protein